MKLSSFCPRKHPTTLSPPCVPAHLRPLIKLAGNLIRNYSLLKRKFCCPEQIIKWCEGARATFIRAQKEGGGRSEDLRRGCRLIYIYSFTFSPELGKRFVSWDTEKPFLWKRNHLMHFKFWKGKSNMSWDGIPHIHLFCIIARYYIWPLASRLCRDLSLPCFFIPSFLDFRWLVDNALTQIMRSEAKRRSLINCQYLSVHFLYFCFCTAK